MINYILSSENENISINEDKKSNYNGQNNPILLTDSQIRNTNESFDLSLGNDFEEISCLFPFNIKNIKNFKEEERIKEKMGNNIKNSYVNKFIIKKGNKIFDIKKEIKLGRLKKNSSKKGKHDKFQKDNIIRRFKAQFIQNIYNYINISFKSNKDRKKRKPVNIIQKISSVDTKSISKLDNIKWFNSKIKSIFSQKISSKFVCYESNYNNKLIQKIYEQNEEKQVIKILEKTIREMWLIYINDDKNNEFPGFNTIKDDINKFKEMKEPEEYIQLYISISKNFINIFNGIKPRKKKAFNRIINN